MPEQLKLLWVYPFDQAHSWNKPVAEWLFKSDGKTNDGLYSDLYYKVEDFKGLESNVIIYIHSKKSNTTINYVAYTRAKYYLYEFVIK